MAVSKREAARQLQVLLLRNGADIEQRALIGYDPRDIFYGEIETMTDSSDGEAPFSDEEKAHYANMVAMLIHDSPERRKKLDTSVKQALKMLRQTMPDASDETLVAFCGSVAFLMAKIMHTPMLDMCELIEGVFDNYIAVSAVLMGAYIPEKGDMPKVNPEFINMPGMPDMPRHRDHDDILEDIINRQYL